MFGHTQCSQHQFWLMRLSLFITAVDCAQQLSSTIHYRCYSKAATAPCSGLGGLGAEVSVPEVTDARNDVKLVVDARVDGGRHDLHFREGVGYIVNTCGHSNISTGRRRLCCEHVRAQ